MQKNDYILKNPFFKGIEENIFLHYPKIKGDKEFEEILYEVPCPATLGVKDPRLVLFESIFSTIQKQFGEFPMAGGPNSQAPSLSFEITLLQQVDSHSNYMRKIHVYFSLIGFYFTILGIDNYGIRDPRLSEKYLDFFPPKIHVSPNSIYEEPFQKIYKFILKTTPYKYVPYEMNIVQFPELHVRHQPYGMSNVFHALFDFYSFVNLYYPIKGSSFYGFTEK